MSSREREKEQAFIKEWNDIQDYKINESNLRAPDFQFFFNSLQSLLRSLNVDIDAMLKNIPTDQDVEKIFYIQFTEYVHMLYHLSDPSFNFHYYDLVNPTPKKCFHVLKMLLNYLKYYEMVKKQVRTKANGILAAYNDALNENNALQAKNENIRKRAINVDRQLLDYEQKLPKIKENVIRLTAEEQSLVKEIAKKSEEIKDFETMLMNYEIKENELAEKVVDEEEYDSNLKSLAIMENDLKDLREMLEHARSSNLDTIAQIDELAKSLQALTGIMDSQKLSHYEDLISTEAKLNALNSEIAAHEQRIQELKADDLTLSEHIDKVSSQIKHKEGQLVQMEKECQVKTDELKKQKLDLVKEIEELEDQLAEAKKRVDEMEQLQQFIISSLSETLRRISNPFE